MEDYSVQAKEIINKILYITIATVSPNGEPWNTPVYSSFDEEYNFFWVSDQYSQHSKNIASNKNVFLAIYDSTAKEGTGRGVYIQAEASMIIDKQEIERILKYQYGRKNKPTRPVTDFIQESPRRVYKAVPKQVWINTADKINGHHVDKRIEVKLR
ncbi:MAG: hypothetical protein A2660_02905 [Candidatus Doudnabacteria bacterium RIFCSPHIGHO2_01_FULL_45_18]|uniref:Pyridoxamine 5'-phosphate oxidase N-terminal domain-containing protein n=1 Tax=Candidatus Doudnabacteria bacterium RIFCSPHIGHO2_01_FULL_45_18 TaxID=1817823 RepID=A0A1F5NQX0_9BACT|nr:MAG: hypothetical protein A2660_02905 [Candidatus Doudnabacteria bacterium RIFCSPHIGHO2_01_FULL_45_18]